MESPRKMVTLVNLLKTGFHAKDWTILLHESCHLRLGNRNIAIGRNPALKELAYFFRPISGYEALILEMRVDPFTEFVECEMGVGRTRASPSTLPCVFIARYRSNSVEDLRIYAHLGEEWAKTK